MTIKTSLRKKIRGVRRHGHTTHRGLDDHDLYATSAEVSTLSGTVGENTAAIAVLDTKIDTTSGTLQTEIDNMTTTHSGLTDMPSSDNTDHDGRYYTQTEVDELITTISGKLDDHDELNNLDYASAGHTGFQPAGDYVTDEELTTTSGNIVSQIPTDFYTQAEVDTISGSLDTKIDTKIGSVAEDTSPELGGDLDTGAYTVSGTGQTYTGDHITTLTSGIQVVNVMFGYGDPPAAGTTPLGTLYIKLEP